MTTVSLDITVVVNK